MFKGLLNRNGDAGDMEDAPKPVPLSVRFKAWWEGVDPEVLLKESSGDPEIDKEDPNSIHVDGEVTEIPQEMAGPRWPEDRVAFCRRLWEADEKDEVVHPGGADFTRTLFKPMPLDSSKSALDLSAGLGGGTRKMAKEEGLWMTGMEEDVELAELAAELSVQHGMGKKCPISGFDPATLELPERKFDGVLIRERLYNHPDKKHTLREVAKTLRPGGHIVLTDFVVASEEKRGEKAVANWLNRAAKGAHPWTVADHKKALKELNFDIRISEDETDDYHMMILEGWQRFVDALSKPDLTREFVNRMMPEAEAWLLLTRALESGGLRYHRFHAIKTK